MSGRTNPRVHAFLCVTGLLMLRYMLWKMKDLTAKLGLKGRRPLEELKRIRIALIKEERHSMGS